MSSNFVAALMYCKIGTKAFGRTKPSKGQEFLICCVGAERGWGTKGHGFIEVALYSEALFNRKGRIMTAGAVRCALF